MRKRGCEVEVGEVSDPAEIEDCVLSHSSPILKFHDSYYLIQIRTIVRQRIVFANKKK